MIPGTLSAEEHEVLKRLRAKEATTVEQDAEAALDRLAKRYAASQHVNHATAYAEVLKTEQGAEIYAVSRGVRPVHDEQAVRKFLSTVGA